MHKVGTYVLVVASCAALAAVGCADDGGGSGGTGALGGGGTGGDTGGTGGDGDGVCTSPIGPIQCGVSICVPACQSPDDCSLGSADTDADNWACNAGACEYLGCHDDGECGDLLVCREGTFSLDVPRCTPACADLNDCVGQLPHLDQDNWACVDGGCDYLGCYDDDECQGIDGGVCVQQGDIAACSLGCESPADCDVGIAAQDEDNYTCQDGECVYSGCKPGECEDAGDFICAGAD